MVTDEYIQWDSWIHPLSSSTDVQIRRIQIPLRLCVCVCVPQNGFLRSSFEMKEHEENGNGKKMGNKLRHVL